MAAKKEASSASAKKSASKADPASEPELTTEDTLVSEPEPAPAPPASPLDAEGRKLARLTAEHAAKLKELAAAQSEAVLVGEQADKLRAEVEAVKANLLRLALDMKG